MKPKIGLRLVRSGYCGDIRARIIYVDYLGELFSGFLSFHEAFLFVEKAILGII